MAYLLVKFITKLADVKAGMDYRDSESKCPFYGSQNVEVVTVGIDPADELWQCRECGETF